MSDVPGLILVIALALVGNASTVIVGVWTWKFLRRHGVGEVRAGVVTAIAATVAFCGLWLLFDLVWTVAFVTRHTLRIAPRRRRSGSRTG